MPLIPVYGFNPDGSFNTAGAPGVLQFPGVPPLQGGFGNVIGIAQGAGDVNASAGLGLPFSGITPGAGGMAQGINVNAPGISGPLAGDVSPYGMALSASLVAPMTEDQPGALFLKPIWGIFDKNMQEVANWDSVIKVDYRHEMKIADFPIERGAFASYNKVQVPFDIRISFAIGSGTMQRTEFLAQLERAVASLDMYVVVTPEAIYPQANLTHMEYSRESRRGLNLLVVDVWVQEVRISAGATFTDNTSGKSPTSDASTNVGSVQPKEVKPEDLHLSIDSDPNLGPFQPIRSNMPTRTDTTTPPTPANMPNASHPDAPVHVDPPLPVPPADGSVVVPTSLIS